MHALIPSLNVGAKVAVVTSGVGKAAAAAALRIRCGTRCHKKVRCGRSKHSIHWNSTCPYGLSKRLANQRLQQRAPIWKQQHGIVAIALHPGFVMTDMNRGKGPQPKAIPPERSAGKIKALMEGLTSTVAGQFLDFEGNVLPW